jgi:hypothetical protein
MHRDRSRKILDGICTGLSDVEAGPDELIKRNQGEVVTHRAPPRVKVWHCKRYCTYGAVTSRRKRQNKSLSGSCASLFESFGVVRTFSVLGQPEEHRFLVAECAGRETGGIVYGERINDDVDLSALADQGLFVTNINRVRLSHFHLLWIWVF